MERMKPTLDKIRLMVDNKPMISPNFWYLLWANAVHASVSNSMIWWRRSPPEDKVKEIKVKPVMAPAPVPRPEAVPAPAVVVEAAPAEVPEIEAAPAEVPEIEAAPAEVPEISAAFIPDEPQTEETTEQAGPGKGYRKRGHSRKK